MRLYEPTWGPQLAETELEVKVRGAWAVVLSLQVWTEYIMSKNHQQKAFYHGKQQMLER